MSREKIRLLALILVPLLALVFSQSDSAAQTTAPAKEAVEKSSEDAADAEPKNDQEKQTKDSKDDKASQDKDDSDSEKTKKEEKKELDPRAKRIAEMEAEVKELKAKAALDKARQDAELSAIKLELEKLSAESSLESARRKKVTETFGRETEILIAENALLKQRYAKLKQEGELANLENMAKVANITRDLAVVENREKAKGRVLKELDYKQRPFENGQLFISDRRIPLNGVITSRTATYVTERIHFFNNQSDAPIFIVIDDSPGGSVMAGYRILKAMEASSAPIHVVVKSYAASMAAIITTLADNSYAYPNAIMLHHQMSSFVSGNMTEQAEQLEVNKEWARRLMVPLCKKLGTTPEKFVKDMYENSSTGDWEEFADRALELKWVGNIVPRIHEQSVVKKPTASNSTGAIIIFGSTLEPLRFDGTEEVDDRGARFKRLPRLHPYDCYFVHNPDGYYRF